MNSSISDSLVDTIVALARAIAFTALILPQPNTGLGMVPGCIPEQT
jgi:hypothetical protein